MPPLTPPKEGHPPPSGELEGAYKKKRVNLSLLVYTLLEKTVSVLMLLHLQHRIHGAKFLVGNDFRLVVRV